MRLRLRVRLLPESVVKAGTTELLFLEGRMCFAGYGWHTL